MSDMRHLSRVLAGILDQGGRASRLAGGNTAAKPDERWSMLWHMGRIYCTHARGGRAIGIAMEMALACAEVDRHGY